MLCCSISGGERKELPQWGTAPAWHLPTLEQQSHNPTPSRQCQFSLGHPTAFELAGDPYPSHPSEKMPHWRFCRALGAAAKQPSWEVASFNLTI